MQRWSWRCLGATEAVFPQRNWEQPGAVAGSSFIAGNKGSDGRLRGLGGRIPLTGDEGQAFVASIQICENGPPATWSIGKGRATPGPLLWLAFLQQHDVGIIFGMQHGKHFAIWRPAENVDRPRSKIRNLMS
jgi:hypothetical protein